MSVAIKKLEGVESVDVSLKTSSADIKLKADNKITIPQLRRIIRSNGYPTKDAQVTAKGRIVDRDGKPAFDLLNGAMMELETRPDTVPEGIVEVTGVSQEQGKDVERLKITTIKSSSADATASRSPGNAWAHSSR